VTGVFVAALVLVLAVVAAVSAQEDDPAPAEDAESASPAVGACGPCEFRGITIVDEPGVLITGIHQDGPAHQAGLRRGDVILVVDGDEVNTADELRTVIARLEPGYQVALSVLRAEEPQDFLVTLGELNDDGRGYLGVNLYSAGVKELSFDHAFAGPVEQFELQRELVLEDGALIVSVEADTPAAAAGLQEGDVVLAVDGDEVTAEQSLSSLIRAKAVGDQIALLVRRDGEELTLTATLTEHPDETGVPYLGVQIGPAGPASYSWIVPGQMDQFIPEFDFDAEGMLSGVLVQEVEPDSPAEAAGLQPDDLITAVDGETIDHPRALVELIQRHQPGDTVELAVIRGEDELTLSATLGSITDEVGETVAYLGVKANALLHWQGNMDGVPRWLEEGELNIPFPELDGDDRHFHFRMPPFGLDGEDNGTFEFEIPELGNSSQA